MDTGSMVESRIDDGRHLLEKLAASGFDVSAAAWVQTADDEKWNLYVVSKTVDEQGLTAAYSAARAVLVQAGDPWTAKTEVTLVGSDTPIGRHLLELKKRYGSVPASLHLLRLGDVAALEVYLYPPIAPRSQDQKPLPANEVVQKVVAVIGQKEPIRPLRVTLQDGTTFSGVPFGIERSGGELHVKFTVDRPEPPRVYPAEAIRSIE